MSKKIFINLPIQDLKKSVEFYTAIGFTNNPHFTDETAAAMMFSEEIYVMLLTHAKAKMFTPKAIANAKETTEVLNALSVESREEVDQFLEKALAHGGNELGLATIMDLCTGVLSKIWMAISGRYFIWIRPKSLTNSYGKLYLPLPLV